MQQQIQPRGTAAGAMQRSDGSAASRVVLARFNCVVVRCLLVLCCVVLFCVCSSTCLFSLLIPRAADGKLAVPPMQTEPCKQGHGHLTAVDKQQHKNNRRNKQKKRLEERWDRLNQPSRPWESADDGRDGKFSNFQTQTEARARSTRKGILLNYTRKERLAHYC